MDLEKNKGRKKNKPNSNKDFFDDEYDGMGKGSRKERRRGNRRNSKRFFREYGDDIEFTDNFEKR
tara:strand:+ start:1405 stop:1599 length:195 start_codon:yes stop_codon:yes gene_type:complete